ncbi:MAG: DNA cytosine methyltransferase [Pyrinomonadaceae bacterium]|nr:DNA cytosine methyltransferase [Pyrinomonadaceae bacterium]
MNTIDLFAGCGGLSLGFQNAGFAIEAAFDNWKPAIEVYRANFNHQSFELNLSQDLDLDVFRKFSPQMIIGGAPCQDFSSAGKRDETLGRADLTLKLAKIIAEVSPEWFVMENVSRIEKSRILSETKDILKNAGYGLTAKVLDASFYGVPQTRKRFFLVGHLFSGDDFLSGYLEAKRSVKPLSVDDYFGEELDTEFYYRHPRSYQRRGIYGVHEPSPTVRGVNRPIPKTYIKHPQDACEPNEKVRPLTTIERSYLQTFPKDFKFFGGKSDLEQMIGNAVPVKLAECVADCINEYRTNLEENKIIQTKQLAFHF